MTTGIRRLGDFCWISMLTPRPAAACDFFAKLLGWTALPMSMPGHAYTVFKLGDTFVAGTMAITPEMGALRPHWATYFTVRYADASARRAVGLDARLCVTPRDIPNAGRFCGITSPQGVTFYAITYAH